MVKGFNQEVLHKNRDKEAHTHIEATSARDLLDIDKEVSRVL